MSFNKTFNNVPYVVAQQLDSSSGVPHFATEFTKTGFRFKYYRTDTVQFTFGISWIAIGKL